MKKLSNVLRVGVIGYGTQVRSVLLPALLSLPVASARAGEQRDVMEVVGIVTATDASARRAALTHHVPTAVGYDALLARDDVDAVVIALPSTLLATATIAALRAGKNVFCEAPGVETPDEAAAVTDVLAMHPSRVLFYGACTRYMPVYRTLRDELARSRQDDPTPRLLSIRYFVWNWFYYDLARFLMGEVGAVSAERLANHEVARLEFLNGDSAIVVSCPTNNPSLALEAVDVTGGTTWLSVRNGWDLATYRTGRGRFDFDDSAGSVWHPSSLPYDQLNPLYLRGYMSELEQFVRCVMTGAGSDSALSDVTGTMRIVDGVRQSIEDGKKVRLC